ncbi:glycosyltransferase family 4 protein [Komarekiella sp. 'clone 1']|uniref:Glycosyltransferase family 4 protein n=1 Tax=Komarekiella delphini-convector SJRDD-AB1 TaxID=2593771 RepID=A0AA40T3H8_9NOST|nr:glycosyltransferase family 4 protein [Komarekiella delphini-convector]MBD6619944.1 glycosyltransferase family 4 protein [Komarekiella delphini-convector SJRDD-AB1]
MPKSLRILYAVGPEDIIEAYNYWSKGEDAPSQVSVTFSSQFYEVCKTLDAKGYAIAQSNQKRCIQDERFIIEHRPVPLPDASGILYHLRQIWCGLHLLASAIRFRANVAVVDSGTTYWFVLSLFSWLGVKVIPSLHCLLWCKYLPPRLVDKLNLLLSHNLFAYDCKAVLVASHDIAAQISHLTGGKHQPILEFFSTYHCADFANLAVPDIKQSSFRILFAGRVERNKGVFDLLEIAKRFATEGRQEIIFDICGEGSALETLRLEAKQAGVDGSFICHGYCSKLQMRGMFERSHVVVVPTRTEFIEGFNRVVCESILSGRPVVTSAVCPALFYVQDAVVEVPPNDVQAYGNALLELYSDRQLYEHKRQACLIAQEQFYDTRKSWGAALKSILLAIQEQEKVKKLAITSKIGG